MGSSSTSSPAYVGIDFGTTNSAVAVADDDGVRLVPLAGASYWRTVLYFEPSGEVIAGAPAIERYERTSGEGRLVQSIKSYLASETFGRTVIFGTRWALEDMVAAYLRQLRAAVSIDLGTRCVVGRPVHYWGAESAIDDGRALARMRAALAKAGFDDVVFEYEPVGAAARYAATLDHDELIVVADLGGGTTDISVVRVGPGRSEVLASDGSGVSGDAFDARIIDAVVAPALGRGTKYRTGMGDAPVPAWLYGHLRRWHLLSFLEDETSRELVERVAHGAYEPDKLRRFARLLDDELGLQLHRAVEGAKVRLSKYEVDRVALAALDLDLPASRSAFEAWIADDLDHIDGLLDRVLARACVPAAAVDRVLATGGSSLVPAVRDCLVGRFGANKLVRIAADGETASELTSVAWGLAARARELFR